jgi:Bestrophin, RFP-TM, chloride channel
LYQRLAIRVARVVAECDVTEQSDVVSRARCFVKDARELNSVVFPSPSDRYFELTAEYCDRYGNLIPVAFVLGFYVNYVASRWWEKFQTIPWPGSCAMLVTVNLHGLDERARLMRRTVMRYVCLSLVMTMASISPPVKKRFPTWQHMVEAGIARSLS